MDRERLDKWCERGLLGLVLAILIFGPLATGAVRTLEFLVIHGLTLGVLVLWGLRVWINPRPQFLWPPICWAVVAFVGYAIARYQFADIEYVARQELIRVLIYAFLFFAILNNLHRQESTQIIIFSLIFLGMVISFYAVYQFLADSNRVWHFIKKTYEHRGSGTYISPNHLAGFLEMLLPLGLAYTLTGRLKPLTKVLLGYASLAIVAGIGVSISRGGWIASGLTTIILFSILAFYRNYRIQSLILLVVIAAAGVFFFLRVYNFQDRFQRMFVNGTVEDQRFQLWQPVVQMWRDHFWWGVGPAHFDYRYRAYRPEDLQLRPSRAHNDYLNTLADWGLVGAAIVASALALLYWGAFKTWRFVGRPGNDFGKKKTNRFSFVLGASLGLLAILLHSAVDFNMHIPANAILAIGLMALLSGHLRFATERYWITPAVSEKCLATLVLLASLLYLGPQGWRHAREFVWQERAAQAPTYSREQIAALEKAFQVEPMNFETTYAIGEAYRIASFEGNDDYFELAGKAMKWYERGMKLNPYDGYNWMRYGMCLHWIGRHAEAWPYFERAEQLDPNGYFTAAHMGWHYVQIGNYAAAKPWFERSRRLHWFDNRIAEYYLEIVNKRLIEAAAPR